MPAGKPVNSQPGRELPLRNPVSRSRVDLFPVALFPVALVLVSLRIAVAHGLLPGVVPSLTITLAGRNIDPVLPGSLLCGTAGLAVFLLLCVAERLLRALSGHKPEHRPAHQTLEQFVADAGLVHIDPRIASEAFRLFESRFPSGVSVGLNDDLRSQLGLPEQDILAIAHTLPERAGRQHRPAEAASILTVYDLLAHVESSPRRDSGQFAAIRLPGDIPQVQAAASPLADLQNASPLDSRFRTRAHFSGVKRRASDYSGPFRRSTDRLPPAPYTGPGRRASDHAAPDASRSQLSAPDRDGSLSDRRGSSAQRSVNQSQHNSDQAKRGTSEAGQTWPAAPGTGGAPLQDSSLAPEGPDTSPARHPAAFKTQPAPAGGNLQRN
jgi:hypothetical protein